MSMMCSGRTDQETSTHLDSSYAHLENHPSAVRRSVLAIASIQFNAPSETFLRAHVKMIAPGETIVLCPNEAAVEGADVPTLASFEEWKWNLVGLLGWRIGNAVRRRFGNVVESYVRDMFEPGISTDDRERVRNFLQRHRPAAVLAEYGPTGCLLWRMCQACDVPLFVHFHGFDASYHSRDTHWRVRYRRMFDAVEGVIAPSQFLAGNLIGLGCPRAKLHVNPYGVAVERFTPTQRLPERLVAVGRLVPKKGPDLTIRAFAQVREKFPAARLDIVGGGELAEQCSALIRELHLDGCVQMHGVRGHDYVLGLMQQASMFVQHSVTASDGDSEGLPNAILEAMSVALPVVSTRHSGIPEAVTDGITGLLVEEHDVEGMAQAMMELLANPARATSMGNAGRKRICQEFTLEKSRDRLRAIMGLPPLVAVETAES